MGECKNCYSCQNCYSCEGTCYTCEVGYEDSQRNEKEFVQFENIWHAIYDALDRIAYQLEVLVELKKKELKYEEQKVRSGNVQNVNVQKQKKVSVRKRVLKSVEEELRTVPDKVGKYKIKKEIEL